MSSPNPPEHEQHPLGTAHRLRQRLQAIYQLKLWRILLTLILLTIFFYAISIWVKSPFVPQPLVFLRFIPWESLATTCLGVVIIGFAYEWFVRNETEQKLEEVLSQRFRDQSKAIETQIPKAMLTNPDVMREILDSDVLDSVIRTGLEIQLGDPQLAKEAYESFLSHLLSYEERRSNYRCNIYLTTIKSSDRPEEVTQMYYEAFINVRYDTILQKDTFRFICVATLEEYDELLKDPTWELRWMAEPTKDFPKETAFEVQSVQVGELLLNIRREKTNGKQVIIADHLELQAMRGKHVAIYYRYKVKLKKRGHLLMVHMPCPTHKVVVELDYTHTDINFVNVLDFFVSQKKPAISYIPSRERPDKIEVELNDWVFPKGGVVFVWVLRAEMKRGFWKLSTGDTPRVSRSSSRPERITHPLNRDWPEKKDDLTETSS